MASVLLTNLIKKWPRLDWWLILATFVLFAFGIATITSVELSRGAEEFVLVKKQLLALGLGVGLFIIAASANYQIFRAYARIIYWLCIALLLGLLFVGQTYNGTTGWFVIAGFSFQPVELMKFALVIELARFFADQARERFGWRELWRSSFKIALPTGLVLMQPDWGSASILLLIGGAIIFFAGIRWRHVAAISVAGVVFLSLGLVYVVGSQPWSEFVQGERWQRVTTFLNPNQDPLNQGYNINQAKIAIGAGGIFGRGLGAGSQSQLRFLPESQTDFVFAVIAEELGFIGVLAILGAYVLLYLRLLSLVKLTRDAFAVYLVIGLMASLCAQTCIHVAVNLALLPATGVTLPFVSSGGSSLMLSLLMLGAVESVASRLKAVDRLMVRTGNVYT
jgi:cell division protein FtsW (lipid II flippase)